MKRPNIIYLVLDDMGFSDLGCFGAEVETPNIDRLAANGLRYNQFCVCPASSPTRASLLTGRDNNAVGMGSISNMVLPPDRPDTQGRIRHDAGTVAQVLHENGYATLCVGKWHVAPLYHETPAGPYEYWPLAKGFDRFYGFLEGDADQFAPQLICDNHPIRPPHTPGYHLSEDLIDRSMDMISDQVSIFPDHPFFLYLCFGVAHSPHQVPEEYIRHYRGRYDCGWDVIREERFQRQKQMGIVPEDAQLPAWDETIRHWDELDAQQKQLYARFQETYAGFITHCDEQVGRLLEFLEEIGELDNTILVLLSDNGASRDGGPEGVEEVFRMLNGRMLSFEDLFARIDEIGGAEMKAMYPKGWAQVSNTPFKEYKGSNYGGGIRTQLIIHWPERIHDGGAIRSQFTHVCDITPTIYHLLGITPPAVLKGVPQMPLDGFSFSDSLFDPSAPEHRRSKYYLWANTRGIIHDGWKAVAVHTQGSSFDQDQWELFHLTEDFAESTDLSAQHPEKLEELVRVWDSESAGKVPHPLREITGKDKGYCPPDSPAGATHFRYLPRVGYIGSSADPAVENRDHLITVKLSRKSTQESGVLLASGGITGGYTLYIHENHLVYEMNNFRTWYTVRSDQELPAGSHTVAFRYEMDGYCTGTGVLLLDGQEIGRGYVETVPMMLNTEGLTIGCDGLTPVSKAYQALGEYPFQGTLHEVTYDIGPVRFPRIPGPGRENDPMI